MSGLPPREAPAVRGVPWIATWSSERGSTALLEIGTSGALRYANEGPGDRDRGGALYARKAHRIGRGTPRYAGVHPRRQRMAMEQLRCQVCGLNADVNEAGVLWMEPVTPGEPLLDHTTHPPVCVPCAVESRRRCPAVRSRGVHVFRVAAPTPWGVLGTLYRPGPDGVPASGGGTEVSYWDPRIRRVLAGQMIVTLGGRTGVDLDEEYARHLDTVPPCTSR